MSTDIESLIAARKELTETLDCCESGARPGSKAWKEESAAMSALSAFDKAHPEVITEIRSRANRKRLGGVVIAGI